VYIYLDESGNLGFDFTKQGTTRFFVVTLLIADSFYDNRKIFKAVERTIKVKIRKNKKKKDLSLELKGSKTDIAVKKYFYRQIENVKFGIYTLILNKARVYKDLQENKEKLYNFVSKFLLDKCPFKEVKDKIIITIDRSKNKEEVKEFNKYLLIQLEGLLPLKTPLEIYHPRSYESKGIQAADMFSWGIFRKWERQDWEWYNVFKTKIMFETIYLPEKNKGL